MAGNKKTKRKQGKSRVHSFTTKGTLPIIFRTGEDDERTLKLMPHNDLADLREGRGTEEGYWTVTNRLNWASTLASMVEFSFDPKDTINAALDAMAALHERFKKVGKFVFKAEELKAAGEGLILADDMHDATTRRQHRDALAKLLAAFPANNFGQTA